MRNVKHFALLLVLSLLINKINAQQVQELENRLSAMRSSSDAAIKTEAGSLNSLIYDSKPTLYYQNNQLTRTGDGAPIRLITDASSIQSLSLSNLSYSNIQLICIKLQNPEDLKTILKISDLSAFSKLRYILFQCSFEICADQSNACEIQKISTMLQGNEGEIVKVLYTVNIDN